MAETVRGFLFFLASKHTNMVPGFGSLIRFFIDLTHIMEITKPVTISKHSSSTTLQQACSVLILTNRLNLVPAAFITHAKKWNLFENKMYFLAKRSYKTNEDAF